PNCWPAPARPPRACWTGCPWSSWPTAGSPTWTGGCCATSSPRQMSRPTSSASATVRTTVSRTCKWSRWPGRRSNSTPCHNFPPRPWAPEASREAAGVRRRSVLYAVVHDDQRVTFGHSPRPEVDRRFWLTAGGQRLVPLGPSLPPVWAELACRALAQTDLQRAEPGSGRRMSTGPRWLGWLLARRRCAHTDPLREPVL